LVDGKALSALSEHNHDTVAHKTHIESDAPGHMDIITAQTGAKAQDYLHKLPFTSYKNLYEMITHQDLA